MSAWFLNSELSTCSIVILPINTYVYVMFAYAGDEGLS